MHKIKIAHKQCRNHDVSMFPTFLKFVLKRYCIFFKVEKLQMIIEQQLNIISSFSQLFSTPKRIRMSRSADDVGGMLVELSPVTRRSERLRGSPGGECVRGLGSSDVLDTSEICVPGVSILLIRLSKMNFLVANSMYVFTFMHS
jgi:hypothetical protein